MGEVLAVFADGYQSTAMLFRRGGAFAFDDFGSEPVGADGFAMNHFHHHVRRGHAQS